MKDSSGSVQSILAHGVDVTEQVVSRRELQKLYEELEHRVEERTLQLQEAVRES